MEETREWNDRGAEVKILCGTELDILSNGTLDYPDEILAELDLVIASIHTGFKQDEATITRRIISAMRNPHVHGIAHPTGRLIGKREGYHVNMESILNAAQETGTFLEINAYPERLDLNDVYSRAAKERGILLGIGTDAHTIEEMDYMPFGVGVARRAWLEKDNVLNTFSYEELVKYLSRKRIR
jgi:DNA polymerase (family 10)